MKNQVHTVTDRPHVYDVEMTDIFGGEANYSWVKRSVLTFDKNYSELELRRKIKDAMGLTGIRCDVLDLGDTITYKPYGMLKIVFATFRDY